MSVAWITITVRDLEGHLVGAQVSAIRKAALAPGQPDTFQSQMEEQTDYIRNRLAASVMISATPHSVPPELKATACWLIIEQLQIRLPGLDLTEDQRRVVKMAHDDLDRAADGKMPVSTPTDPVHAEVQSAESIEVVTSTTRRATRDSLRGL